MRYNTKIYNKFRTWPRNSTKPSLRNKRDGSIRVSNTVGQHTGAARERAVHYGKEACIY